MDIRPKQLARIGEFSLEEAVLDVLLEARYKGECLGPAAISKRTGIFREPGYASTSGNDYIVWGILGKLAKHRRIEKCPQNEEKPDKRDGWQLTDTEFHARRDDA